MILRPSGRALRAASFAAAVTILATPAVAQVGVGYPPSASPFRDVEYRQELTGFTGWFNAGKDPAGVAPQSGPMIGARYEVRVGGPAQFMVRLAHVTSERRVLDPRLPDETRDLGVRSWPLWAADLGLTVNLTGQKSFRNFVPLIQAGAGIVSDFKSQADTGGFKFGTAFAFTYGLGIRWVPGGRFQARVDLTDYAYQINYPDSYYLSAPDTTSVLSGNQSTKVWKQNIALTVGASYLFFR